MNHLNLSYQQRHQWLNHKSWKRQFHKRSKHQKLEHEVTVFLSSLSLSLSKSESKDLEFLRF